MASKGKVASYVRSGGPLKVEVGSGARKGTNGWLTVDMCRGADIFWDLRYGLPFPDNSLDGLYSSHFMEHLTFQEGEAFLRECVRALKPGGTYSVCVPNAKLYLEAYVLGKELQESEYLKYSPAYHRTTKIDYVNYICYMDGHHKYMFDQENLLHRLTNAGFSKSIAREFDATLDMPERAYESIYALATK